MVSDSLRNRIAALVCGVWTLAMIDALVTQSWVGLGIVTPVMMLVAAFIFGDRKADREIKDERIYLRRRGEEG